ncbi:MAG: DUF1048 domain-containing protein [Oscillospiraceae bacterium]|nr:DUF1048 domain-containing protein [Oscillospiraceae bacterium]
MNIFMNIFDKLVGARADKKSYRKYRKRVDALQKDYNIVINEMQSYIWNCGGLDGSFDLLCDLVSLFETSAAEGKRVLDVTGEDVIAFCDKLIRERQSRTWQDAVRAKYNERIHRKLEKLKNEPNIAKTI